MKINPLGIQSYQHLNRQEQSPANQANADSAKQAVERTVIEPQSTLQKPALAVKVPEGTYAKYLSDQEKQALDMLFEKFHDTGRFGAAFQAGDAEAGEQQALGRLVDVKV